MIAAAWGVSGWLSLGHPTHDNGFSRPMCALNSQPKEQASGMRNDGTGAMRTRSRTTRGWATECLDLAQAKMVSPVCWRLGIPGSWLLGAPGLLIPVDFGRVTLLIGRKNVGRQTFASAFKVASQTLSSRRSLPPTDAIVLLPWLLSPDSSRREPCNELKR